jgi:hypothetical protein
MPGAASIGTEESASGNAANPSNIPGTSDSEMTLETELGPQIRADDIETGANVGTDGTHTQAIVGDSVIARTDVESDAGNEAVSHDTVIAHSEAVPSAESGGEDWSSGQSASVVPPVTVDVPVLPLVPPVIVADPALPVVSVPDAGTGETFIGALVDRQQARSDTKRERDTGR